MPVPENELFAASHNLNRRKSIWGYDKTSPDDNAYYLPREMVGDTAYRYQGVGLHGGLAAASLLPPFAGARAAIAVPNLAYAGWSLASGRTQPDTKAAVARQPETDPGNYRMSSPSAYAMPGGITMPNVREGQIPKTPLSYPDDRQTMVPHLPFGDQLSPDVPFDRWRR
jgi:hypothetical protein